MLAVVLTSVPQVCLSTWGLTWERTRRADLNSHRWAVAVLWGVSASRYMVALPGS